MGSRGNDRAPRGSVILRRIRFGHHAVERFLLRVVKVEPLLAEPLDHLSALRGFLHLATGQLGQLAVQPHRLPVEQREGLADGPAVDQEAALVDSLVQLIDRGLVAAQVRQGAADGLLGQDVLPTVRPNALEERTVFVP